MMLKVLDERCFEIDELLLVASERSVGKQISFRGNTYTVIGLQDAVDAKPDIALFSAGGSISLEWAPKFAQVGATVIDNSSAWRMDPSKKLIVPEINGDVQQARIKLLPIQLFHNSVGMALLRCTKYQIKRLDLYYQSVSELC